MAVIVKEVAVSKHSEIVVSIIKLRIEREFYVLFFIPKTLRCHNYIATGLTYVYVTVL